MRSRYFIGWLCSPVRGGNRRSSYLYVEALMVAAAVSVLGEFHNQSFSLRQCAVARCTHIPTPPQSEDRASLEQFAHQIDDAWTAADVEADTAVFSPDATARFADDPPDEGWGAIRGQFRSFFKDRPIGLRHVTKIERIDQISPDLAM